MCSLSAYPRILFEKCDLFVDDNEAPTPDPFDNVYDNNSLFSFHAPQDLPGTAGGLVPSFKLEEDVPKPSRFPSVPVTDRILFEKSDLFVDDNEAPLPDPFDNVYDDHSLSPFHAPQDIPVTAEGLATSLELMQDVVKFLGTLVPARIIFEESELDVDNNEAPLPDPFDNVYDDNSLSAFYAPQDLPGTTEGLVPSFELEADVLESLLAFLIAMKSEETKPNGVQMPFHYVGGFGKKRSFQVIIMGLPDEMNVRDFSMMIDLPEVLQGVGDFIEQTGKGHPTHIMIDVSSVTSRIIFEQNQLEVDDNEAPPPEPFDLIEQGDERVDPGHATNQAEEGAPRLGIVSSGDLPEVGKHKETFEESVEDQERNKRQRHGSTERKGHSINVEESEQEARSKKMRHKSIATAASKRAVDAQATEAFKVQSSSQFEFKTSGASAANTKTLSWDYPNPEGDGNIDQVHSLSKLGQLLPCLGWQGVGPGFKWVLGEVLWDTHRASNLNDQANDLESRYDRTGYKWTLQQATDYAQQVLVLAAVSSLATRAEDLYSRHVQTGAIGDLDQAIEYCQEALTATPLGHNDRPGRLNNLAICLSSRYERTGAIGDLDQAIEYSQEALAAIPLGHNDRPGRMSNLAGHLDSQYERTGAIGDLDQAIEYGHEALAATPLGHNERPTYLSSLASHLSSQYDRTGAIGDLDQAIEYSQEALAATPLGHNDRPGRLNNLAKYLSSRYERTGAIGDLDQAIEYCQDALAATPLGHNDRPTYLSSLASHLSSQYDRTGAIGDLDQAIEYSQEALAATPLGHNGRQTNLSNLSIHLNSRYTRTGAIEDLDRAIEYSQEALAATPLGHNHRPAYLNNLSIYLNSRYTRTGAIEDLDRAIEYSQEALAATPLGHNDRLARLSNLAKYLSSRYERTGAIGELDQAIEYCQEALAAIPLGHNNRPTYSCNLAGHLNSRYQRTGAIGDLDQATEHCQDALAAIPVGHNDRPAYLNNQASQFSSRYERTGAIGDLAQAIEYGHEALAATPLGHNERPTYLSSLASHLSSRYKRTGAIGDLDQATEYSQEALAAIPVGHGRRPAYLNFLANYLSSRYERTGVIGHLDHAIEYSQKAFAAAPQDRSDRSKYLVRVGVLFLEKFFTTQSAADLDNSIHFSEEAWGSIASIPSMRVNVALTLFFVLYVYPKSGTPCYPSTRQFGEPYTPASSSLLQKSFSFLEQAVLHLPGVSPRILERQDQQFNLLGIGSLAESTASCALMAGKAAPHALTLLELSRGIIIGFAIDCRGDLSELKIAHPKLCQTFTDLRGLIDIPPRQTSDDLTNSSSGIQSFDNAEARDRHRTYANQRREKAVREMETTIAKIRELPGHEGFQLPPPPEQLMVMAKHGPIVVFICSVIRSDAIIVTSSAIISITLPELHYGDILDKLEKITGLTKGNLRNYITRNKTLQEILCWLWNVAVEPVVRALELTVKSAGDPDLAHIWWIGVGTLSMAPFHAAGDYSNSDPRQNILSYAVSSYTPTIKALSYARERDLTITDGKPDSKLLLISMTETPGGGRLPDAAEEVKEIIQATNGSILTKHLPQPSAQTVLDELKQGSFKAIHFACHGKTDNKDPSGSHLILLKDGKADKLTVEDISGQSIGGVQLAYLSACSTAKNPDLRLANETIHIASGFQLAGFNHVIATMWPSESAVCREISQDFYRFLFDGNGHSDGHWKVRIALHGAVKKAQEKYPHSPLKWAPFIHMGA